MTLPIFSLAHSIAQFPQASRIGKSSGGLGSIRDSVLSPGYGPCNSSRSSRGCSADRLEKLFNMSLLFPLDLPVCFIHRAPGTGSDLVIL
jgi:hypothetical protein